MERNQVRSGHATSWTAAALCGLGLLAAAVGAPDWPFEVAFSLLPTYALGTAILALLMLARGAWRPGVATAVYCLVALTISSGQFRPGPAPIRDPDVTVIWANILHSEPALETILAHAEENDADILVFAEFGYRVPDEVPQLKEAFPYVLVRKDMRDTYVAIASRLPLENTGYLGNLDRPGLVTRVRVGERTLTLAGVHPHSPGAGIHVRSRNRDLRQMASVLPQEEALLLVGDFNTVPWSPALAPLRARGLERIAYGPWSSWLTPLPFIGVPIDHAFIRGDLRAHVRLGPMVRSDHWPLIIAIKFE